MLNHHFTMIELAWMIIEMRLKTVVISLFTVKGEERPHFLHEVSKEQGFSSRYQKEICQSFSAFVMHVSSAYQLRQEPRSI